MRKRLSAFWLVVLFIIAPVALFGQITVDNPKVVVLPLRNTTGQGSTYDTVATTITDTTDLVLRLLGEYEVVDPDPQLVPDEYTYESVRTYAAETLVDNVIFGTVRLDENNEIVFDTSLYDRGLDEITVTEQRSPAGLLDVFDTTDELVSEFVTAFSGIRIGFGSIAIQPDDPDAEYIIYVDGELAGENVRRLDRVLIGSRTIRVDQPGFAGDSTVFTETIQLTDGETVTVEIDFPDVNEADYAFVMEQRRIIDARLPYPQDMERVRAASRRLDRFFGENPTAFSRQQAIHAWDERRINLADDYAAIESFRYFENEEYALTNADIDALIDRTVRIILEIPEDAAEELGFDDRLPVDKEARRNLAALSEMIRMSIAYLYAAERYPEVEQPLESYDYFRDKHALPYSYRTQIFRTRSAGREYRRYDERRKPLWQPIVGGLGLATAGWGGYSVFRALEMADLGDEYYDDYEDATSVQLIEDYRKAYEKAYESANNWAIVGAATLAGGTTMMLTALIARLITIGRPERKAGSFSEAEWLEEMNAAERLFPAVERGETGVLVVRSDRSLRVGSQVHASPWYTAAEAGDEITIDTGELLYYDIDPVTVRVDPGLNIVILR